VEERHYIARHLSADTMQWQNPNANYNRLRVQIGILEIFNIACHLGGDTLRGTSTKLL
jgi:hypothetical protein